MLVACLPDRICHVSTPTSLMLRHIPPGEMKAPRETTNCWRFARGSVVLQTVVADRIDNRAQDDVAFLSYAIQYWFQPGRRQDNNILNKTRMVKIKTIETFCPRQSIASVSAISLSPQQSIASVSAISLSPQQSIASVSAIPEPRYFGAASIN
jgi:hypothetical protein